MMGLFGRGKDIKKEEGKKELEGIKDQIQGQPQPSIKPTQVESEFQKTPFTIVKKRVEQRQKVMYSPSGQQIRTGEMETIEFLDPILELTLDDMIDMVAGCRGMPIGDKLKRLLTEA